MIDVQKIGRLAVSVFDEHGQLKLTGEGTLKKAFLSAHLSGDSRQIFPPREHYFFHRNSHTTVDQLLVKKTAAYFIISEAEAEEWVHLWEGWVKEEASVRAVFFGDFGTFRKETVLEFEGVSLLYYQWLPTLSYISSEGIVGNRLEQPSVNGTSQKAGLAVEKEKKERKLLFPVIWITMGFFFLFSFWLWSEPLSKMWNAEVEWQKKLVNVAPKYYDPADDEYFYTDTESSYEDEVYADRYEAENKKAASDAVNPTDRNYHSITDDTKDRGDSLYGDNTSKIGAGAETTAEEMPRCTLIVGAFASPDNIDNMIEVLRNQKVETVKVVGRKATLVGARIDCGDEETISRIRAEVEPEAWLYNK